MICSSMRLPTFFSDLSGFALLFFFYQQQNLVFPLLCKVGISLRNCFYVFYLQTGVHANYC